ncbi:MAG: 4'-phosphopantetheinyl transferase superfamily protein [Pseudomonadota bacterium]
MTLYQARIDLGGIVHNLDAFSIGEDAPIPLSRVRTLIAPDEAARADCFDFARDRNRFLRGRAYLRRRLAQVTGIEATRLQLVPGVNGKPELAGSSLAFNMSHSGDRAVLVIAARGHVGIDLECLDRTDGFWDDLSGLASICLTPTEQAFLQSLPPESKRRRFLEFWTAKEARMKLSGEGLSLDPASIALRLVHGRPVGFETPDLFELETRFPVLPWDDAVCCLVSAPKVAGATPDLQRGVA